MRNSLEDDNEFSDQTSHLASRNDTNHNTGLYGNDGGNPYENTISLGPPQLIRSTNTHRRLPLQVMSGNGYSEYVSHSSAGSPRYPSSNSVPATPLSPSEASMITAQAVPIQAGVPMHHPLPRISSDIEQQQREQWDLYHSGAAREVTTSHFPLEGAMTYILKTAGRKGNQEDCLATCLALGAKQAFSIQDATHALWCGTNNRSTADTQELDLCLLYSIPIVDAASWLQRISGLYSLQHWSEVDVSKHCPKWEETPPAHASAARSHSATKPAANNSRVDFFPEAARQNQYSTQEQELRRSIERYNQSTWNTNSSSSKSSSAATQLRRKDSLVDDSISQFLQETQQEQGQTNTASQEDQDLRRAMELSMLDVALVVKPQMKRKTSYPTSNEPPHVILGIMDDATVEEIRMAYKKCARGTHPDKGGKPGEFEAVARAYRAMLKTRQQNQRQQNNAQDDLTQSCHFADDDLGSTKHNVQHFVKNTAHWDMEIQDHWNMIQSLFQTHDGNIQDNIEKQKRALASLGLEKKEAGASNHDENDRIIRNSCFYLSLATSYLHGLGAYIATDQDDTAATAADNALTGDTALQLKRIIEAAVLEAHPEWATNGMVGEEVQAFSDFIVYSLDSPTSILADWAVAIFDTVSGYVDIYKGKNYNESEDSEGYSAHRQNTITIRYVSGDHYQPLLPSHGKPRPSLNSIMSTLDDAEVYYVVTDGAV